MLHVLWQLIAAPGKAAGLLATLSRAQAYAESDAEPGCLQYRISVDPSDPHKVCVFEVYVSRSFTEASAGAARTADSAPPLVEWLRCRRAWPRSRRTSRAT